MDFASIRLQPQKLSFQTAKQLTKALGIIVPNITDVRLKDIESGLSVVLDNTNEISLGSIGNGAVTWASSLIAIFDLVETMNQQPSEKPILILVDEIGAGIHYSIMVDVWRFLNEFRKQNCSIQFVFTSHSDDCIRAFCEVFSDDDDSSIVRLHQTSVGKKVMPTEYRRELFQNIISGEWEVRG
jgi:AAA15 family ATPase/GTPase